MSKSREVRTLWVAAGNLAWLEIEMWVREGWGRSLGRTLDALTWKTVGVPEGFLSWSDLA